MSTLAWISDRSTDLSRHDPGVVLRVGRGRHLPADLRQVRGAANRFVDAGLLQPLDQQHQVDALPAVVHRQQVLEDAAIGVVVKVRDPHRQRDFVEHLGQQEDAAQDGPLGLDVLRNLLRVNVGVAARRPAGRGAIAMSILGHGALLRCLPTSI